MAQNMVQRYEKRRHNLKEGSTKSTLCESSDDEASGVAKAPSKRLARALRHQATEDEVSVTSAELEPKVDAPLTTERRLTAKKWPSVRSVIGLSPPKPPQCIGDVPQPESENARYVATAPSTGKIIFSSLFVPDEDTDKEYKAFFRQATAMNPRMRFIMKDLEECFESAAWATQQKFQECLQKIVCLVVSTMWKSVEGLFKAREETTAARKEAEEVASKNKTFQLNSLREVTKLRDMLNGHRKIDLGQDIELWEPLNDLDEVTRALVMACVEEKMRGLCHLTEKAGYQKSEDMHKLLDEAKSEAKEFQTKYAKVKYQLQKAQAQLDLCGKDSSMLDLDLSRSATLSEIGGVALTGIAGFFQEQPAIDVITGHEGLKETCFTSRKDPLRRFPGVNDQILREDGLESKRVMQPSARDTMDPKRLEATHQVERSSPVPSEALPNDEVCKSALDRYASKKRGNFGRNAKIAAKASPGVSDSCVIDQTEQVDGKRDVIPKSSKNRALLKSPSLPQDPSDCAIDEHSLKQTEQVAGKRIAALRASRNKSRLKSPTSSIDDESNPDYDSARSESKESTVGGKSPRSRAWVSIVPSVDMEDDSKNCCKTKVEVRAPSVQSCTNEISRRSFRPTVVSEIDDFGEKKTLPIQRQTTQEVEGNANANASESVGSPLTRRRTNPTKCAVSVLPCMQFEMGSSLPQEKANCKDGILTQQPGRHHNSSVLSAGKAGVGWRKVDAQDGKVLLGVGAVLEREMTEKRNSSPQAPLGWKQDDTDALTVRRGPKKKTLPPNFRYLEPAPPTNLLQDASPTPRGSTMVNLPVQSSPHFGAPPQGLQPRSSSRPRAHGIIC